jgi:hypothetical protein
MTFMNKIIKILSGVSQDLSNSDHSKILIRNITIHKETPHKHLTWFNGRIKRYNWYCKSTYYFLLRNKK